MLHISRKAAHRMPGQSNNCLEAYDFFTSASPHLIKQPAYFEQPANFGTGSPFGLPGGSDHMSSKRRGFSRAQSEAHAGRRVRPVVGGLAARCVCALVLLVGIFALAPAGASAEPLCTDTWTGPAEGRWEEKSDWSTGEVPTSASVVCIASGKTVTVTGGSNQAGVLEVKGALTLSGILEVTNAWEASSVASLSVAGGTLKGAGTVDVSGSLSWTEGELSGSGSTVVLSGGSAALEASARPLRVAGGHLLVNEGTMTQSIGHLIFAEGSELKNVGVFKVNSE